MPATLASTFLFILQDSALNCIDKQLSDIYCDAHIIDDRFALRKVSHKAKFWCYCTGELIVIISLSKQFKCFRVVAMLYKNYAGCAERISVTLLSLIAIVWQ